MSHGLIRHPYLTATASDSRAIRDLLDKQEAEYAEWRSKRKPLRHPFATPKLNSPFKTVQVKPQDVSQKPLWLALLERSELKVERPSSTASHTSERSRRGSLSRPSASRGGTSSNDTKSTMSPASSLLALPSLKTSGNQQPQRASSAVSFSLHTKHADDAGRKPTRKKPSAAKRRLQKHLYDFHSSIVFTIATDTDDYESMDPHENEVSKTVQNQVPTTTTFHESRPQEQHQQHQPEVVIMELPPPEGDPYIIPGLPLIEPTFFEYLFDHDWATSDVDRIVCDAVERRRIQAILRTWYRVLVLHFRQYAGKSSLRCGSESISTVDLLQVPSRLQFLEDLNVNCVDPPKFGIDDVPLRREGLIPFLLQAGKMIAAHPVNPTRFKMLVAEGIAMSEAVRCLMLDHVAVYAQLQDPTHFRELFLVDHHDRQTRRLRHILSKHDATLSGFFFDVLAATSTIERNRGGRSNSCLFTEASTTMAFNAFMMMLTSLGVVPSTGSRTGSQRSTSAVDTPADASNKAASIALVLDGSRAMRIFHQCLDVGAEMASGPQTIRSKQQLTYPEFVEALLRVTLVRNETAICRGGVDVCPGQQTNGECHCRAHPPDYDLATFIDVIDEFFTSIQRLRAQRARKRSEHKVPSTRAMQMLLDGRTSAGLVQRQTQRHNAISSAPGDKHPLQTMKVPPAQGDV